MVTDIAFKMTISLATFLFLAYIKLLVQSFNEVKFDF